VIFLMFGLTASKAACCEASQNVEELPRVGVPSLQLRPTAAVCR
jgi:hypothetical protein